MLVMVIYSLNLRRILVELAGSFGFPIVFVNARLI